MTRDPDPIFRADCLSRAILDQVGRLGQQLAAQISMMVAGLDPHLAGPMYVITGYMSFSVIRPHGDQPRSLS